MKEVVVLITQESIGEAKTVTADRYGSARDAIENAFEDVPVYHVCNSIRVGSHRIWFDPDTPLWVLVGAFNGRRVWFK